MMLITSSGASETLSARKRTAGRRGATPRITSAPPPSGICTSSSTTSGSVATMHSIASPTVAGVADDVDEAVELGAHAGAEQAVVVDEHDARERAHRRHHQLDLRALARARVDLRAAAVALHPAEHRLAQPAPVGRHGVEVEARAAVAHEHLDVGRRAPRRRR